MSNDCPRVRAKTHDALMSLFSDFHSPSFSTHFHHRLPLPPALALPSAAQSHGLSNHVKPRTWLLPIALAQTVTISDKEDGTDRPG